MSVVPERDSSESGDYYIINYDEPGLYLTGSDIRSINDPTETIQEQKGFINGTRVEKKVPHQMVRNSIPDPGKYHRQRIKNLMKKNQKRKVLGFCLALVLVILPLILYSIDFSTSEKVISIDGEFDDWLELKDYSDSETDQVINPSTNLIAIKITQTESDLFIYTKVYEKMFHRIKMTGPDNDASCVISAYYFIDTDLDPDTGYFFRGIGTDILIKITGQKGMIIKSQLLIYPEDKPGDDWNNWHHLADVVASNGDCELEVQVPRSYLKNKEFLMTAAIKDGDGNMDVLDYGIGYGTTLMSIELTHVSEGFFPGDGTLEPQPLVEQRTVITGKPTRLENVNYFIDTEYEPEHLGVFQFSYEVDSDRKDVVLGSTILTPRPEIRSGTRIFGTRYTLSCEFNEPVYLEDGMEMVSKVTFLPDDPSANSKFELDLDKTVYGLSCGSSTILNAYQRVSVPIHMNQLEERITIDGRFSDWENVDGQVDRDEQPNFRPDIDIDTYKIHVTDCELSFYFSVKGMLLRGANIPEIPVLSEQRSSIIAGRSSDDTSNKKANAGENNEGTEVIPEMLLGEDKAYIFIDSDGEQYTGYTTDWLELGADYCIELTGKNGRILEHNLLRYLSETGTKWNWEKLDVVDAAVDLKRLETQIDLNQIGVVPGNVYQYCIYCTDWDGNSDNADGSNPVSRAFPGSLPNLLMNDIQQQAGHNSRKPDNEDTAAEGNGPEAASRSGTRSLKIGNTTTYLATAESNQYKLVRGSNGIWFAFWQSGNQILGANSTNASGDQWNNEMVLIGNKGRVVNTSNNVDSVSIAIERNDSCKKDVIHLICKYNFDDVLYTKLVDLGDFDNSSGTSWKVANGSRSGYELIDSSIGFDIKYPSIAVNNTGIPHVVWTQDSSRSMLLYTFLFKGNWIEPIMITNDSKPFGFSVGSLDVDINDNIHLAWYNFTTGEIDYKRCLSTSDNSLVSSWRSANQSAELDRIINGSNRMYFPSMVSDVNGNVWVITHELNVFDIWYARCTDKNWSGPQKLASQGDLKFPTIGSDSSGYIHAVWVNTTTDEIIYSYYTDRWSRNYTIISGMGQVKYYPSIERHMWSSAELSGIIYVNSTSKDISFGDAADNVEIPEFVSFYHLGAVSVLIIVINISFIKKKKVNGHETK